MFVSADQNPYTYELVENERGKFSYYSLWKPFYDQEGFPGIKPPWGTLTALNLINGKVDMGSIARIVWDGVSTLTFMADGGELVLINLTAGGR